MKDVSYINILDSMNKGEVAKIAEDALKIVDNFSRYQGVNSILVKGNLNRNKPKVSITIPTFKRVSTLRDTVESCLGQKDFDDFVVIISDNNPERGDETEQYVSSLNDDRIIYYKHESNIGMYGNINRLYELSLSEYTVCVHDDDILLPHFVSICYDFMKKYPEADIVYPGKLNWRSNEERPIEKLAPTFSYYKLEFRDFLVGNPYPPTGMMAKTSSIFSIGGYEENTYPSSDYFFNVKAIENMTLFHIEQPLYIYRWDINTSLKKDTILKFLILDDPLVRHLAGKSSYLKVFTKFFSLQHILSYKRFYEKYSPEGNFDELAKYIKINLSPLKIFIIKVFSKFFSWHIEYIHRANRKHFLIAE